MKFSTRAGNPTVEVDVELAERRIRPRGGAFGASTGTREALELRDGDKPLFRQGRAKSRVANINGEIAAASSAGRSTRTRSTGR